MLKKTITYKDYFGFERTEDFYFHMTESELMKMQIGAYGSMAERLNAIISAKDAPTLMNTFEDIILNSYGEKSEDGRRFMKSEEIKTAFKQTEAYNKLFMELITDDKAAADFVNGIIPQDNKETANAAVKQITG